MSSPDPMHHGFSDSDAVEHHHETARERLDQGDEWDQWYASLDLANDDLHRRKVRAVDGGDHYHQFQNEITHNESVMLALEHNFDRLRAASRAVVAAEAKAKMTRKKDNDFGRRATKAAFAGAIVGGLAILLCVVLPNPASFVVWCAVLGPVAAIGFGVLSVFGGQRGSTAADLAAAAVVARTEELEELRAMVGRGERELRRPASSRSTSTELFPMPRQGTSGQTRV